jgi:DNA-binding CsgD family transcriptional regulator
MNDQLLQTIETIYDCIGDEFDHPRTLETYSKTTGNTGVMLADIRPLLGGFGKYFFHNIPEDAVAAIVAKHDSPETNKLFRDIAMLPERTPVLRRMFMSDEKYRTTLQYKNTNEPWGLHSDGAALFKKGLITSTLFGFIRQPGQPEIGPETLGLMAILNNHYRRAMSLQNRLDKLEQAVIRSSNVLDMIEFGLVLYGPKANPIFVNAAARRIIDDQDGIALSAEGLEFIDPKAELVFQNMIDALYQPKRPLSAKSGGIILAQRTSSGKPYSAMVVPLPKQKNTGMEGAAAAIFLFDPLVRKTSPIELFVSSYRLTRSEAELAHSLVLGSSLDEAAAKRGISRNTAKSHLHAIFTKTSTNRQSELVSLLLRSVAGINLRAG